MATPRDYQLSEEKKEEKMNGKRKDNEVFISTLSERAFLWMLFEGHTISFIV